MKTLFILILFASINSQADWVKGHYRANGTYVQSYERSQRDQNTPIYSESSDPIERGGRIIDNNQRTYEYGKSKYDKYK